MCDSHRRFESSEEGGVAVAERPKQRKPDRAALAAERKALPSPEAPVAQTKQEVRDAAAATMASPKAHAEAPARPQAVAAPQTTTAPRKDPPKAPAAPVQKPQPAPVPAKKPEPAPVAQAPVYRPPVQPTESPEARKLRLVTQKLSQIREREGRVTFSVMAMHQSLNEFVNLLGTPFVNANAPRNQRMSEETRAKIAVSDVLRTLKIDEKLWPRFLSR